jgi:hypothetical protein
MSNSWRSDLRSKFDSVYAAVQDAAATAVYDQAPNTSSGASEMHAKAGARGHSACWAAPAVTSACPLHMLCRMLMHKHQLIPMLVSYKGSRVTARAPLQVADQALQTTCH